MKHIIKYLVIFLVFVFSGCYGFDTKDSPGVDLVYWKWGK